MYLNCSSQLHRKGFLRLIIKCTKGWFHPSRREIGPVVENPSRVLVKKWRFFVYVVKHLHWGHSQRLVYKHLNQTPNLNDYISTDFNRTLRSQSLQQFEEKILATERIDFLFALIIEALSKQNDRIQFGEYNLCSIEHIGFRCICFGKHELICKHIHVNIHI